MATVYWSSVPSQDWNDAGNWFSDNPPVTPNGSIPANGDDVVLLGSLGPSVDPSAGVVLLSFDSSQMSTGVSFGIGFNNNVTFSGSGTITLGISGDVGAHTLWTSGGAAAAVVQGGGVLIIPSGTLTLSALAVSDTARVQPDGTLNLATATATFAGSSTLNGSGAINFSGSGTSLAFSGSSSFVAGTLGGLGTGSQPITFAGTSSLAGGAITVTPSPVPAFNGSSQMTSGTVDVAAFNNSSIFSGGTVNTSAAFHDSATMTAGNIPTTTFNNTSSLTGGHTDSGTFNDASTCTGGTHSSMTFNDSSVLSGGTLGGSSATVRFNDASSWTSGTVNASTSLIIDSSSATAFTGTYDGAALAVSVGTLPTANPMRLQATNPADGSYIDVTVGPTGTISVGSMLLTVDYPGVSSAVPVIVQTVNQFVTVEEYT